MRGKHCRKSTDSRKGSQKRNFEAAFGTVLKGLSHEIDFKNVDKNGQNLA
jgi:hypothetical protein